MHRGGVAALGERLDRAVFGALLPGGRHRCAAAADAVDDVAEVEDFQRLSHHVVIRLEVSVSTWRCETATGDGPSVSGGLRVENAMRRPNCSSPFGPYIIPAGSENTVTARAGQ